MALSEWICGSRPRQRRGTHSGLCVPLRRLVALALSCALLALGGCGDDGELSGAPAGLSEDFCQSAPFAGFGFDRFGGWKGIATRATGRFRVEQIRGVWWFVTPEGHVLFSNGPTGVDPVGDRVRNSDFSPYLTNNLQRYGSLEAWADHASQTLCALGIRSLGGWMGAEDLDRFQGKFPYTVNANFYTAMPRIQGGPPSLVARRDVFVPDALDLARAVTASGSLVARCARDPWCIGVYIENETPYMPSLLAAGGHLDAYLSLPAGAPGKRALQEFFQRRYGNDVQAFNQVWGTDLGSFDDLQQLRSLGRCSLTLGFEDDWCVLQDAPARRDDRYAFEAQVAERVATLARTVLDETAPGVLNLGPRLVVGPFHPSLIRAIGPHVDVVSTNNYDVRAFANSILSEAQRRTLAELGFVDIEPFRRLEQLYQLSGKPVLITEWFYRRARPGGSYPPILPEVPDGAAQAAAYRTYMERILSMPFVVGEHWFQWVDQPPEGRFDGENQLIGLVDLGDNRNEPLASTVAAINQQILGARLALEVRQ